MSSLKTFLNEAIDMLDDMKDMFGMFQTQTYYRLKKDIEMMSTQEDGSVQ